MTHYHPHLQKNGCDPLGMSIAKLLVITLSTSFVIPSCMNLPNMLLIVDVALFFLDGFPLIEYVDAQHRNTTSSHCILVHYLPPARINVEVISYLSLACDLNLLFGLLIMFCIFSALFNLFSWLSFLHIHFYSSVGLAPQGSHCVDYSFSLLFYGA